MPHKIFNMFNLRISKKLKNIKTKFTLFYIATSARMYLRYKTKRTIVISDNDDRAPNNLPKNLKVKS